MISGILYNSNNTLNVNGWLVNLIIIELVQVSNMSRYVPVISYHNCYDLPLGQ